jgi:SPW repeat-containing protein
MPTKLTRPTHWEDWLSAALGLWLFVSPWVIGYGDMAAAQNAVVVGFLLLAAEFVEFAAFRPWEEWANAALGIWLIISPWVFGAALIAAVNFGVTGVLVLGLALYEMWDEHRHQPHPA